MRAFLVALAAANLRNVRKAEPVVDSATGPTITAAVAAQNQSLSLPDAVVSNATNQVGNTSMGAGALKDGAAMSMGAINVPDGQLAAAVDSGAGGSLAATVAENVTVKEPLRCELRLACDLNKVHEHGGIHGFTAAAQAQLAEAAKVDAACVHVMNVRGAYEHRPEAAALLQAAHEDAIVDFEIVDCGADMDQAYDAIAAAVGDAESLIRTGTLSELLEGATVVKGGAPSAEHVAYMTAGSGAAVCFLLAAVA